jgi:peptidoglycan/xylan/chitin deacetylase (PgdA/CDA1 family)
MIYPKHQALFTNDVETTSILNHSLRDSTGTLVKNQGLPRLLELYSKHDVKATFFFNGDIVKLHPEVVKMVEKEGHEVGSHGMTHEVNMAFDLLPLKMQIQQLKESKSMLEDLSGNEVISFRAPAARVSKNIATALIEAGFKIDSSVSSQRLDMFFSFGSFTKLNWLFTPRRPYFTAENNIFRKGSSEILEIPISAFIAPYIGTFMRISPRGNRMTRRILFLESAVSRKPIVFLTHPNEYIDEERDTHTIQRRSGNYFSYLMGDIIRHRLKIRNLGEIALPILEKELSFFQKNQYSFVTCRDYYKSICESLPKPKKSHP